MTKEDFKKYEDACDVVCMQCLYCKNEDGEDDGDICFTCAVRRTYEDLYSEQRK